MRLSTVILWLLPFVGFAIASPLRFPSFPFTARLGPAGSPYHEQTPANPNNGARLDQHLLPKKPARQHARDMDRSELRSTNTISEAVSMTVR